MLNELNEIFENQKKLLMIMGLRERRQQKIHLENTKKLHETKKEFARRQQEVNEKYEQLTVAKKHESNTFSYSIKDQRRYWLNYDIEHDEYYLNMEKSDLVAAQKDVEESKLALERIRQKQKNIMKLHKTTKIKKENLLDAIVTVE